MGEKLTIIRIHLYAIILSAVARVQSDNKNIKITVGTTSGSNDTADFIHQQLIPAYDKYKRFLDVEFIPWGRTRTDTDGCLICQFGISDCWANRLHRCVLSLLRDDQDAQMRYMACEFSDPFPAFRLNSYLCAESIGLNLIDIDYCVMTSGEDLEDDAEEASNGPVQVINFVPFVLFNNIIDVNLHNQALRRLSSILCIALADDPSTGITHCQS